MKATPAIALKTISMLGKTACIALDLGKGIKVYHPVGSEQEAIESLTWYRINNPKHLR